MPGSSERNQTKRRRRAAAALGITLVVAGGFAYAATRDGSPSGEPSTSAAPPPADADAPSAGEPTDGASGADTATTGPDTDTTPEKPAAPADSDGSGSGDPGTPAADTPADPTDPAPTGSDPILEPASRRPVDPGTEPDPDPSTQTATFSVSGSPAGSFRPGVSQPLDVTITNPNGTDLTVTGLTVAVGPSSVPACGSENMVVTQQFSGTVVVPAHATRSLSALNVPVGQWPVLTMPDTPVNQDACQQASFQLTYTGTGTVQ